MTTFSSLYTTYLSQELGTDDSTVLFTAARRKKALIDGIREFADLTECLARVSSVTITSTATEYDLNSTTVIPDGDYVRLAANQDVEFRYLDASSNLTVLTGKDDLPQRTPAWLDVYEPGWRQSSGSASQQVPSAFYLRPDGASLFLGFWPPPSSGSSASMEARVPYVPYLVTVDTSAEPFVIGGSARTDLRPYHLGPVHFAAAQLEKLRRDTQASQTQLQRFAGYVQRYVASRRVKGGQVISPARRYFRRSLGGGSDRPQDPRT